MPQPVKVIALSGSYAEGSSTLAATRLALAGAADAGAEIELFTLGELQLPFYSPEVRDLPASVRRWVEAVAQADGHLWVSPLYHGTVSGAFKNALDWLELLADAKPAYLTDKPVGLIATAGGQQSLQAINTLEFAVRALRGWTVPFTVPVNRAWDAFDEQGQAKDPALAMALHQVGAEVTRAAFKLRQPVPSRQTALV